MWGSDVNCIRSINEETSREIKSGRILNKLLLYVLCKTPLMCVSSTVSTKIKSLALLLWSAMSHAKLAMVFLNHYTTSIILTPSFTNIYRYSPCPWWLGAWVNSTHSRTRSSFIAWTATACRPNLVSRPTPPPVSLQYAKRRLVHGSDKTGP